MVGTIRTCSMSPTQKERLTNLSSTICVLLSSKGIEPFTVLTNSFTENHHYQSDHLPLIWFVLFGFVCLFLSKKIVYLFKFYNLKLINYKLKIYYIYYIKFIFRIESTWTWTRTFSLKGRHSTTQVLLSYKYCL